MTTRYMTGVLFAILAGFLVVVSQAFSPTVLGWVAFAFSIGLIVFAALAQLDRTRGAVQRVLDGVTVVLAALMLGFSVSASGAEVIWLTFAFAVAIVAVAFTGLTLNEIVHWRGVRELSNLRWLPARGSVAPARQEARVA